MTQLDNFSTAVVVFEYTARSGRIRRLERLENNKNRAVGAYYNMMQKIVCEMALSGSR